MAFVTETYTPRLSIKERFAAARTRWQDASEKYRVYRRTFNELSALSDRDLADLGLHRSLIAATAHKAAYQG